MKQYPGAARVLLRFIALFIVLCEDDVIPEAVEGGAAFFAADRSNICVILKPKPTQKLASWPLI